jgi:GT2 family glycosyltransferase
MKKVYVVIVTYNGEKWVHQCFGRLRSGSYPVHMIVVDNGSTDATLSLLETHYPEVTLIRSAENLGFGQANNIGIRQALAAGADYVFLLNQDAWTEDNTIAVLVDVMEQQPAYGIVSPVHLNGSYSAMDTGFARYFSTDQPEAAARWPLGGSPGKEIYPVAFVNAAAWMMSRACLERVGLFHPIFFHYGEDSNYTQRVLHYGFKVGICTAVTVCHDRYARQESEATVIKYYKVYGMVTLMDIRRKHVLGGYLKALKDLAKPFLLAVLKLKWGNAGKIAGTYTALLGMYPEIKRARKEQ